MEKKMETAKGSSLGFWVQGLVGHLDHELPGLNLKHYILKPKDCDSYTSDQM